jgi:hypothetical protein
MRQRFYFSDTHDTQVDEIRRGVVAPNFRFIFTHPIEVKAGQMLELDNGQWFMLAQRNGQIKVQLDGKWST